MISQVKFLHVTLLLNKFCITTQKKRSRTAKSKMGTTNLSEQIKHNHCLILGADVICFLYTVASKSLYIIQYTYKL